MTSKSTILTVFLTIFISVLCVALAGVFYAGGYNLIPATQILEGIFFIASFFMFFGKGIRERVFVFGIGVFAYLLFKYVMSVGGGATTFDFLLSVKAFVYLAVLSVVFYFGFIPFRFFGRFVFVLCILFFVKYFYVVAVGGTRPGIFTENNFELLFLSMLVFRFCIEETRYKLYVFILYSLIVFLSFSRSALLLVAYLYFVLFVLSSRRFLFLKIFGLFAVVAGVVLVFTLRQPDDLDSIDRFVFLQIFLSETADWSLGNYIFGNLALTPLSRGACYELAYYETLFSDSGDGGCYSVILHSFLLRTIFDHGALGLSLVFGGVWLLVRSAGFGKAHSFSFLTLIFLNGLSVSSMNSVYAALGLLIFIAVKREGFFRERDGSFVAGGLSSPSSNQRVGRTHR